MENKENMMMLEELINKLELAGDDEEAMQKAFEDTLGTAEMSEELNEEELERVSGGLSEWDIIKLLWRLPVGQISKKGLTMFTVGCYDYFKYGDPYRTYSREEVAEVSKKLERYYNMIPKWIRDIG